jgi:NADH:ubiquinone oxidoreductase subunit F (NADH-binding)
VRIAVSLPLSLSNPHVLVTYSTASNALKWSRDALFVKKDLVTLKEELTSMMREMTRKRVMGKKKSKRDTHLFQIYWRKG